jgi:hypothetical protein
MSYIVLSLREHTLVQPNGIMMMATSLNFGQTNVYAQCSMQIHRHLNVFKEF